MHATVRSFRAADAASALKAVKDALGPDAVILTTREIGGGMFRRPEIEITAALTVEPAPQPTPPAKTAPREARKADREEADETAEQENAIEKAHRALAQNRQAKAEARRKMALLAAEDEPLPAPRGLRAERETRRDPIPEPRLQRPEPLPDPRADLPEPRGMRERFAGQLHSAPANDAAGNADIISLKRELDEARREMRVIGLRSRGQHELSLNPAAAEVFGRLVHQGIEDSLAEEMVRQALFDGCSPQTLFSGVRDLVASRIIPGRAPWLKDSRRVIALVGPTGVGKTTTLAKIAAKAIVESKMKVALITVDTYRIGASEQIQRYGSIMRVPTFVARDRNELQAAMEQTRDADLVLIDTAGRAVSEAIAKQAELLRTIPGIQLYLVLSAASGSRELAAAAERYRKLQPERIIFSKLDEAVAPGSLLSAAVRIGRPVACLADGQRVPEDVHAVSSDELCELVLGTWETAQAQVARRK